MLWKYTPLQTNFETGVTQRNHALVLRKDFWLERTLLSYKLPHFALRTRTLSYFSFLKPSLKKALTLVKYIYLFSNLASRHSLSAPSRLTEKGIVEAILDCMWISKSCENDPFHAISLYWPRHSSPYHRPYYLIAQMPLEYVHTQSDHHQMWDFSRKVHKTFQVLSPTWIISARFVPIIDHQLSLKVRSLNTKKRMSCFSERLFLYDHYTTLVSVKTPSSSSHPHISRI